MDCLKFQTVHTIRHYLSLGKHTVVALFPVFSDMRLVMIQIFPLQVSYAANKYRSSGYFNASSFVSLSSSFRFPQSLTAYRCKDKLTSAANRLFSFIASLIPYVTMIFPISKYLDINIFISTFPIKLIHTSKPIYERLPFLSASFSLLSAPSYAVYPQRQAAPQPLCNQAFWSASERCTAF